MWEESEFGYDALLMIPHEDGILTGIIEGLNDRWIPPKWHQCVSAPQRLKEFAEEALSSTDMTSLIATTAQDTKILWIPVLNEYKELEWASFSLIHGKPRGRRNSIPWIKLESAAILVPPTNLPEIPDHIEEVLGKLAQVKHRTVPAKLRVNVNDDLRVYEVNIEGESIEESHEFARTQELVHFLRTPVLIGGGYRALGRTFDWDYKNDIDYDDDRLSFLKPLVHRSRFYPDEFHFPRTCRELLASTNGDDITLVIQKIGSTFHVQIDSLPHNSSLRSLEEVGFDIYALALLAECKALFDPRNGIWHPIHLNVNSIMDLRFSKLHHYPRLEEAIRAADIDEFDWSRDTWFLSTTLKANEMSWSIISQTTRNPWMKQSFTFILTPGRQPDEEIKQFRQEIESIVPLSNLINLDDELDRHKATLQERYQEFQRSFESAIRLYEKECVFRFKGLEVRGEQSHKEIIVVLESEEGDFEEILVVRSVKRFQDDTQYAGSISSERIDTEVNSNLARYRIEEEEIAVIRDKIKQALAEEGVRFHEE